MTTEQRELIEDIFQELIDYGSNGKIKFKKRSFTIHIDIRAGFNTKENITDLFNRAVDRIKRTPNGLVNITSKIACVDGDKADIQHFMGEIKIV